MKCIKLLSVLLLLSSFIASGKPALDFVLDLKSNSGHRLIVLYSEKDNTTHAAVSSSNLQCMIDVAIYNGFYEDIKFKWVETDTLEIAVPSSKKITKLLVNDYKKCGNEELFVKYTDI